MLSLAEIVEREDMILLYSDFHKDAYGFRPRGLNLQDFSLEELRADFARFAEVCKENAEIEAKAAAKAVEAFKLAIKKTIAAGAGNHKTALRWLAEAAAEQYGWDYEHYLWSEGILFTDYGKKIAKEIAPIFGRIAA